MVKRSIAMPRHEAALFVDERGAKTTGVTPSLLRARLQKGDPIAVVWSFLADNTDLSTCSAFSGNASSFPIRRGASSVTRPPGNTGASM